MRTENASDDFDFDGPADWGACPDPMCDSDDYYGHGKCTCGFAAAVSEAVNYDHPEIPTPDLFGGCAGCDPVRRDDKPYGWGIERFEDPALSVANAHANRLMDMAFGAYSLSPHGRVSGIWAHCGYREGRDRAWNLVSTQDRALTAKSGRVWSALCGCCRTHREAVERYGRWAERATKGPLRVKAKSFRGAAA